MGTLSYAFLRSMKIRCASLLCARDFSVSWDKQNALSMHDLPALNPLCSSNSIISTSILFLIIRPINRPIAHVTLMPLKLSHSVFFPFLYIGLICPVFHSFGMSSPFKNLLKSLLSKIKISDSGHSWPVLYGNF